MRDELVTELFRRALAVEATEGLPLLTDRIKARYHVHYPAIFVSALHSVPNLDRNRFRRVMTDYDDYFAAALGVTPFLNCKRCGQSADPTYGLRDSAEPEVFDRYCNELLTVPFLCRPCILFLEETEKFCGTREPREYRSRWGRTHWSYSTLDEERLASHVYRRRVHRDPTAARQRVKRHHTES